MPYAMLSKEGRRKRTYRSKLAALGVRRLLSPLIAAAAVLDHEEAARQEAECAKARRQQRQRRLEQQLAERNPAANGPAAIMLRAAARVEGDDECFLCRDNDALEFGAVDALLRQRVLRTLPRQLAAAQWGDVPHWVWRR